jgi:uncharacterized protein (DUF58 family)
VNLPGRRGGVRRTALRADREHADGEPLLDGDMLRQLERLRFSTLTAIVAGLVGDRQGTARVAHLEFADYRPYVAGDELRRIDWNIYRRLHQLVVKVGIEDGRLSLALLVDVSRSMRVGEPSKFRAAQRLAAALAVVALLRGDEADVHVLGDGRARPIVRLDGPSQISALLRELERVPESLGTRLETSLGDYARAGSLSDVALLISDANVPLDELAGALRTLAASARTTGLLHLVSPDELATSLRGPIELRDAETGRAVETTLGEQAALEYAERVRTRIEALRELCREAGVRYVQARSDEDPLDVLLAHAGDAALSVA